MIIKAQQIATGILGAGKALATLGQSIKAVVTGLRAGTLAMNAHKTATEATTVATVGLQGALGLIGIALLAVSAVVSIVSKGIANKNEKTQESIRLANESVDLANKSPNNLTN